MDLVFWGHEHECRIDPEESLDQFRITQPGSSVATSLSPGEAVPKNVGLLTIVKKEFYIQKLPLRTVRPFVFDNLSLEAFSDIGCQLVDDEVVEKIKFKIEDMLQVAETLITGIQSSLTFVIVSFWLSDGAPLGHSDQPTLPLLRLRIEHESEQHFTSTSSELNNMLNLKDRVANFEDVVKLVRKRADLEKIEGDVDQEAWDAVFSMHVSTSIKIISIKCFKRFVIVGRNDGRPFGELVGRILPTEQ